MYLRLIMNNKGAIRTKSIAQHKTIIIAVAMFVLGFFSGICVAVYKTGTVSTTASKQTITDMDYAQRAKVLRQEVAQNPGNTSAWVQLGHTYFDMNKHTQAIDAYEKSIELNPNNADVLTDLGIMYRRNGQPREAIVKFDKAISVNPKHETARFNKGIVLMHDLGDREGAIQAWEDLLEINPVAMAGNNQSVDQMVKHYKDGHDRKNSK
jgi:cytochrome c-type biogenesis protein CcmH/NrfG